MHNGNATNADVAFSLVSEMINWVAFFRTNLLTMAVLCWVHTHPVDASEAAKASVPNDSFWQKVFQRPTPGSAGVKVDDATSKKIKLGLRLFNDPRLSGDQDMSCGTCHIRGLAFADGLVKARGRNDKQLKRNTPSLYNLATSTQFNWDASAYSLEGQAEEILELGCDGFLQKPFRLDALASKVREALD